MEDSNEKPLSEALYKELWKFMRNNATIGYQKQAESLKTLRIRQKMRNCLLPIAVKII